MSRPGPGSWGRRASGRAGLQGLHEGDRYRIRSAQDEVFEGRVVNSNPPWDFAGTVLSPGNSLQRVAADRFSGRTSLNIWLSYWGSDPARVDALEHRWQGMLDLLLAESRPSPA